MVLNRRAGAGQGRAGRRGGAGRFIKNLTFAGLLQFAKDGYAESIVKAIQLHFQLTPRNAAQVAKAKGETKGVEAVLRRVYGESDGRGQGNWQEGQREKESSRRQGRQGFR